jgi:hypothetical protein
MSKVPKQFMVGASTTDTKHVTLAATVTGTASVKMLIPFLIFKGKQDVLQCMCFQLSQA